MPVDVSLLGIRSNQSHVVERCHQDAAVQSAQMHVAVQLAVDRCHGFATVARTDGMEPVFGAAAQLFDAPGQVKLPDHGLHSRCEASRQRHCATIEVVGQHVL